MGVLFRYNKDLGALPPALPDAPEELAGGRASSPAQQQMQQTGPLLPGWQPPPLQTVNNVYFRPLYCKILAEFRCPHNESQSVFSGGVYIGKHSPQAASVRLSPKTQTKPSEAGLFERGGHELCHDAAQRTTSLKILEFEKRAGLVRHAEARANAWRGPLCFGLLGTDGVVGSFLGDIDIVGMRLPQASRRDLDELGLLLKIGHCMAATVAHTGAQAAHELINGLAGESLVGDAALDASV